MSHGDSVMSESFNILVVIDLLSDLDTTIDNHLPSVASETKAMNTRYVLISFTGAALAKTFACVSSRDVCRQMCLNKMCASLGAYIRIEDRNGRPAYKQLHEKESEQRVLYYKSGTWLVMGKLGKSNNFPCPLLKNTSKSTSVPTSGWQYFRAENEKGVSWHPATGFTVSFLNDLSSGLCSDITIKATGEAASTSDVISVVQNTGWGELAGTFSPLPGKFSNGRQMFENNITGEILAVGDVSDCWTVVSLRSEGVMAKGSSAGMCPAIEIPTSKNWSYCDLEGDKRIEFTGSSNLIVACARHSFSDTSSSTSAESVSNIDDIMKYIEGEPSPKPNTKSKKKRKSKKNSKACQQQDSNADGVRGCETIEEETAEVTIIDVPMLDHVNIIKESTQLQLEEQLRELNIKVSASNNRILKILSKSIQEKEKFIQEKESDLECPVCLDTAQVPIYMCEEQHAICSSCRMNDKVDKCPLCRVQYFGKPRRHRYAEKNLEDLVKLREELSRLTEERSQLSTDKERGVGS